MEVAHQPAKKPLAQDEHAACFDALPAIGGEALGLTGVLRAFLKCADAMLNNQE